MDQCLLQNGVIQFRQLKAAHFLSHTLTLSKGEGDVTAPASSGFLTFIWYNCGQPI